MRDRFVLTDLEFINAGLTLGGCCGSRRTGSSTLVLGNTQLVRSMHPLLLDMTVFIALSFSLPARHPRAVGDGDPMCTRPRPHSALHSVTGLLAVILRSSAHEYSLGKLPSSFTVEILSGVDLAKSIKRRDTVFLQRRCFTASGYSVIHIQFENPVTSTSLAKRTSSCCLSGKQLLPFWPTIN